jgi:hypothetical protein
MKKLVIVLIITGSFLPRICHSQTIDFTYGYDASGNRTSRTFVYKRSAKISKDTLSYNSIEKKKNSEIKEMLGTSAITVYPNPTKGLLTVNIPLTENDVARVTLYDIQGKSIMDYKNPGTSTDIDLTGLPSGFYLLRISLNNKPLTWKIIKED